MTEQIGFDELKIDAEDGGRGDRGVHQARRLQGAPKEGRRGRHLRRHRQQLWSPRCARGPRAGQRARPASCRSATPPTTRSPSRARSPSSLGVNGRVEDISAILEAVGCYARRDEAIRRVIPEYGPGWKSKIVLPRRGGQRRATASSRWSSSSPDGDETKKRLPMGAYLEIVAATNFKQRIRKMLEYYHADRLNYAVAGTPNRLEYDQGFFVKNGDGAADVKPIAHLYKTQVYQLAAELGRARGDPQAPADDRHLLAGAGPGRVLLLAALRQDGPAACTAKNHGHPPAALTEALGLSEEQIARVYKDIDGKRRATRYGHLRPVKVEEVPEVFDDVTPDEMKVG